MDVPCKRVHLLDHESLSRARPDHVQRCVVSSLCVFYALALVNMYDLIREVWILRVRAFSPARRRLHGARYKTGKHAYAKT